MNIALVSQFELPDWEVDDRPLHAALEARGITWSQPPWNDPNVDWSSFDIALIRTTWDYAADREAFVAWAERIQRQTRLVHNAEIILWNTDKHYLADLEANGVAIAPTVWLEQGNTLSIGAIMADRGWQRGFLKPIFGQSARETLRFDATEDGIQQAQAHVDRLCAHEGLMLQPYLPAVETEGEFSAIFYDGKLAQIVQKIPVTGDYRVMDDFGATDQPATLDDAGLNACQRALEGVPAHFDLLYARVDLLKDLDENWVLTELELVEPSLFFRHAPHTAEQLVEALLKRVS
ncbi:MAG: hypothetical protein GWP91_18295 [Rhodobacterales bacterium]|nr:hypothetical protein [Rhodobacterales bacterium]